MGSTNSKSSNKANVEVKVLNESDGLLSDNEVTVVHALFSRICAENGGMLNAKTLCSKVLELPQDNADALSALYGMDDVDSAISQAQFVKVTGALVNGGSVLKRQTLFKAARKVPDDLPKLFQLAYVATGNQTEKLNTSNLVKGFIAFTQAKAKADFVEPSFNPVAFSTWTLAEIPSLHDALSNLLNVKVLGGIPRTNIAGVLNAEAKQHVASSEILNPADVFALSCVDHRCQKTWELMFSTNKHGLSFDAMAQSLIGYEGPTLIVVKDMDDNSFGALVSEKWHESGLCYGKCTSMLFSLAPTYALRRARTDGSAPGTGNFQYLKIRGRQGLQGLGLGGDETRPRFFLSRNLDECRAGALDLTYDQGPLRQEDLPASFMPQIIEVWGLGGESARLAQLEEHQDMDRMQHDRRVVDKKQFVSSGFDREFLLGQTFQHEQQQEQRDAGA